MTQETSPAELIKQAALRDNPDKEFVEAPDLEIDLVDHKLFYEIESLKQNLVESQETHKLWKNFSSCLCMACMCCRFCISYRLFVQRLFLVRQGANSVYCVHNHKCSWTICCCG